MFVFQAMLTNFEASMSLGESFIQPDSRESPLCNRRPDCKLNSNLFSIDIIGFARTPDRLPFGAPIDHIKMTICKQLHENVLFIAYTVGDNVIVEFSATPQQRNFRVGVCPLH